MTWLQAAHADLAFTQNLTKLSARYLQLLQEYQDRAHRRHLAAIKTLAQVRKLLRPQVQVNIARRQINKIG